MLWEAGINNG
ncbi:BnaC09g43400D [Brassica napus]|uniref:BnaC09g43400D protein n=1 Tax=Brassica napus TaxID=3708 RepID=A0A078F8X4_BRANA|nr:BnaC09g43400D [Brassica napus]